MPAAPLSKASFSIATPTFLSPLLADGHNVVSRKGTVASGIGVLLRGAILKIVPATGVITVPATAAECNCVLADDIDSTAATVQAGVYLTGRMKADAVVWPGVLVHADVTEALRDVGIYLESVVISDGSLAKSVPTQAEQEEALKNLQKARAALKEATKALEEEKQQPASDSPSQYLTPEEKESHPGLATAALSIARADFEEEQDKSEKPKESSHLKPPGPRPPEKK